ncbi:hypothetical protein HRbin11_00148 [bacterium HR11]|nr:hypothetical protein HRbin11_00148 [bacterium HR11]
MVRRLWTSAVVYTLGWLAAVGLWGDVFLNSDAIHYYAAAEAWYVHRWQDWTAEEYLQAVEPFRYLFRVEPTTGRPTSFYPPGMALVLWPGMALGDAWFRRVTLAGWAYVPYPLGRVLGAWVALGSLTIWAMVVLEILVTAWAGVRPGRARWAILLTFWGTPWLYYASRTPLFSHMAEVALLILGLGGVRMAESSRPVGQRLGGLVSGGAWGAAVTVRYALLAWVGPAALAAVLGMRRSRRAAAARWALWGAVGVAPWIAFLLWYQAAWMEHIGATGYSPRLFVWNYPWPEALRWVGFRAWALWLHPVRGFAVWHPIVLAALIGWTRLSGMSRNLALASTAGLLAITIAYHDWWAGVACGQRLLMGLVPWIPFGVARFLEPSTADPLFRPGRTVGRGLRWTLAAGWTLWNVLLTVGFIAGAWRGYDDGRLGERFPFYHILRQMGRDITATAQAFRQATWASLGHVRHWLRLPTVLSGPSLHAERPPLGFITPPRSDAPAVGPVHPPPWAQLWTWSVQVPADGTVRWVVQVYTGPPYQFPSDWLITAVSDPVPVLAGSETWRLRIGYPSPFIRLWRGASPIPVRRHYESLSRLLLADSLDRARIRLIQLLDPSGPRTARRRPTMTVWELRPVPPWRPREALHCTEVYVDTRALPTPKVSVRPAVPVLAYARPVGDRPWFQGVRTFQTSGPVPVPFHPMPVTAGPYQGTVVLCQEVPTLP